MSTETYAPPVAKLLAYGEPEPVLSEDWPNYLELGIGPEHIPDLIRMVADKDLRTTDPDEKDPKYWAVVHAWRALGHLRDVTAVEPLLQLSEELISDESIIQLDDVLIDFGLKTREQALQERRKSSGSSSLSHLAPASLTLTPRESYWRTPTAPSKSSASKKKTKTNMAKASRKKNRKKR